MVISLAVEVLKYLRGELEHSTELWTALRIVGQFIYVFQLVGHLPLFPASSTLFLCNYRFSKKYEC
jgi:hypothetical protein